VSAEDGVVVGGGLVSVALALGSVGGGEFGEALVEGAGAVQNGAFEAGSEGRFDGTGGAFGEFVCEVSEDEVFRDVHCFLFPCYLVSEARFTVGSTFEYHEAGEMRVWGGGWVGRKAMRGMG